VTRFLSLLKLSKAWVSNSRSACWYRGADNSLAYMQPHHRTNHNDVF